MQEWRGPLRSHLQLLLQVELCFYQMNHTIFSAPNLTISGSCSSLYYRTEMDNKLPRTSVTLLLNNRGHRGEHPFQCQLGEAGRQVGEWGVVKLKSIASQNFSALSYVVTKNDVLPALSQLLQYCSLSSKAVVNDPHIQMGMFPQWPIYINSSCMYTFYVKQGKITIWPNYF